MKCKDKTCDELYKFYSYENKISKVFEINKWCLGMTFDCDVSRNLKWGEGENDYVTTVLFVHRLKGSINFWEKHPKALIYHTKPFPNLLILITYSFWYSVWKHKFSETDWKKLGNDMSTYIIDDMCYFFFGIDMLVVNMFVIETRPQRVFWKKKQIWNTLFEKLIYLLKPLKTNTLSLVKMFRTRNRI